MNGAATQGVDAPQTQIPDHEQVKKWLERDLMFAINLLTAIKEDYAILEQVTTFTLGRLNNHLEAQKNQTKLDI